MVVHDKDICAARWIRASAIQSHISDIAKLEDVQKVKMNGSLMCFSFHKHPKAKR